MQNISCGQGWVRRHGREGWTYVATGTVGHDSSEYATVECMGDGMHVQELGEGHGGFEESPCV